MTKLNWSNVEGEKKQSRHGSAGVSMLEMPVSWNDVVSGLVPEPHKRLLYEYIRSVIVADLNGDDLPRTPRKLESHIERHIQRKGGVLKFAKWLVDYDAISKAEARRVAAEKRGKEKQFLHRIRPEPELSSSLKQNPFLI